MKIGILSIGDEVLSGTTLNSNAHYIAQKFSDAGYSVVAHMTVSDDAQSIETGIDHLFGVANCVISTGGLGPTCDDLTRDIVADYFKMGMRFDHKVAASILKRFGEIPSLEDQATIPKRAEALHNKTGTAPGLWFSEGGKFLILLPGIPGQMRQILRDEVMPRICERFPQHKPYWTRHLNFFHLSEGQVDPLLRTLRPEYPDVTFGIYPNYGCMSVKLSAHCSDGHTLDEPVEKICEKFGEYLYSEGDPELARALQEKMIAKGLRLGLAESCTGGAIAARLTSIPDSSLYFEGSLVTYSNQTKENLLGVKSSTLMSKGAVSQEVVRQMVMGIHEKMDVDIAVAVSGIAGPGGGSEEKPVGTIWAALQRAEGPIETFLLPTREVWPRDLMITFTVNYIIGEVYSSL